MPALLLTLLAAVTRALAMPGWFGSGAWPLIFIAVALRFLAWRKGQRLWVDYLGGVVFWCFTFSFLTNINPSAVAGAGAVFGASLILGSCWWVEGILFRLIHRRLGAGTAALLALPTAEYLRMTWFYLGVGGVPWASLGLALEPSFFYPYARVFGEFGLLLLATTGGVLLATLRSPSDRRLPALTFGGLLLLGAPFLSAPATEERSLRCLTIQPNVSVEDKNILMDANQFFAVQFRETNKAFVAGEEPDVLLWAETMWPYPTMEREAQGFMSRPWPFKPDEVRTTEFVQERQRDMAEFVLRLAPEHTYFLTGAHFYYPITEEELGQKQSVRNTEFVLFDHDGSLVEHFSKQELVPFGEYLPFGGAFPGAEALSKSVHEATGLRPDFDRTDRTGPLPAVDGLPSLGGVVCWENMFEAPFRNQANAGAEAVIVLSNEDWFGLKGLEMDQMLAASRLRAAESGLALLRATNTGVTCLVSADGSLEIGLEPGTKGWWGVDLPLKADASSPYRSWGWLMAPLWSALGGLAALLALVLGRPKEQNPPVSPVEA
ncbi:MAG: apolipoprotein N-acyltransferase [Planctomycetota bacterium]